MKRFRFITVLLAVLLIMTCALSACNKKDNGSKSTDTYKPIDGIAASITGFKADSVTLYTYSLVQKVGSDVVNSQEVSAKINRTGSVKAIKEVETLSLNSFNPEIKETESLEVVYYANGKEGVMNGDVLTWTTKSFDDFLNIKSSLTLKIDTAYFASYEFSNSNAKLSAVIKDDSIAKFSGVSDTSVKNMKLTLTVDSNKYGSTSSTAKSMVAPKLTSIELTYEIGSSIFTLKMDYDYTAQTVNIPD